MHAWRPSIVEVEGGIDDACVARVLCRANEDMRYVRTVSLLYSLASSSELTSSVSSVLPRRSRTSSRARSKYICPMAGDASTVADTVSICSTVTDATAPLTSSAAAVPVLARAPSCHGRRQSADGVERLGVVVEQQPGGGSPCPHRSPELQAASTRKIVIIKH